MGCGVGAGLGGVVGAALKVAYRPFFVDLLLPVFPSRRVRLAGFGVVVHPERGVVVVFEAEVFLRFLFALETFEHCLVPVLRFCNSLGFLLAHCPGSVHASGLRGAARANGVVLILRCHGSGWERGFWGGWGLQTSWHGG